MTGEYFCRGIVSIRSWIIYCFNVIEFNDLVLVVNSVMADYGRASLMLPYGLVDNGWMCFGAKGRCGRLRSCSPHAALQCGL